METLPMFTMEFNSDAQTIANAALGPFNHNFGVVPKLISVYFECIVADQGYAIGERLYCPGIISAANNIPGVQVSVTNMQVTLTIGSLSLRMLTKTGAVGAMTSTSWKIFVQCWA